jgi:transglutaminase-like putative cysteine protease
MSTAPITYALRHITQFTYSGAVSESVMELRMRPADDGAQRCLQFDVQVEPEARVFAYRDFLGNWVHHFDLPRAHEALAITAQAQVQVGSRDPLPDRLSSDAWHGVDESADRDEHWMFRQPSRFAAWTEPLRAFVTSIEPGAPRAKDPLTRVRETMAAIHGSFEYAPNTTRVDSPIDEALAARRGVCQDFTHIMIATIRHAGLPCRYVSGYIAPAAEDGSSTIATHAWLEVLLPELGWVGMDPTHNTEVGQRHIRVAVGRDYADVPPTRGTFKGNVTSSLAVSVGIIRDGAPAAFDGAAAEPAWRVEPAPPVVPETQQMQQQQ